MLWPFIYTSDVCVRHVMAFPIHLYNKYKGVCVCVCCGDAVCVCVHCVCVCVCVCVFCVHSLTGGRSKRVLRVGEDRHTHRHTHTHNAKTYTHAAHTASLAL